MASSDSAQLTTLLHRLGQIVVWGNPVTALAEAISIVAHAIRVCADEPAGDPDRLDQVAASFQAAATRVGGVENRVRAVTGTQLPDVWHGVAGGNAQTAVTALANDVAAAPPTFAAVQGNLTVLAGAIRDARAKHRAGREKLHSAYEHLAHPKLKIFGVSVGEPIPDPSHIQHAIEDAAAGLHLCQQGYQVAEEAARRAASQFRDAGGKARVGAMVTGDRFSALDAAVLADQAFDGTRPIPFDSGVLTPAQMQRATQILAGMSPQDYAKVQQLLAAAGSDKERAYILKAVAAGHPVAEIGQFAGQIRGKSDAWLDQHLTLAHPGSDKTFTYTDANGQTVVIDQYDETTCGSTSILAARSLADPIFTLGLTTGGPNGSDSAGDFERRLSAEEQRVHDESTHHELGPFDYPQAIGTPPWGVADQLNRYSGATGTQYESRFVDNTDPGQVSGALSDVEASVDRGQPVPVLIGDSIPRHYVLVVGHEGDKLQIYEPSSGSTVTVNEDDFRNGTPAFAQAVGYPNVQAVVVPKK
jgi:hypothetical protein